MTQGELTRVDKDGVPMLVQKWVYASANTFEVTLFNGNTIFLDWWAVRDNALQGVSKWSKEMDSAAIDQYIEKYWEMYLNDWWQDTKRKFPPILPKFLCS